MKNPVKPEHLALVQRIVALYPRVESFLHFRNPFELLVSVILSAQCTDAMVNKITPALFQAFPGPKDMAAADLGVLENLVHATGFYRSKAQHLKATARILVEDFQGEVPGDFEQLVRLPGVGRKTAHVICGTLFSAPAIIVDTHFGRVVQRLELTRAKTPDKIEESLGEWLPPEIQYPFSMAANLHGRVVCKARKPLCAQCPLAGECPSREGGA